MKKLFLSEKFFVFTFLFLIYSLFPEQAWAFADPIVHKVNAASMQVVRIGKGVIGISAIFAVIMLALGHPQWKWFLYILIAGICLTTSGTIIDWING
jgi:TrbC/VIRB2 family pilin